MDIDVPGAGTAGRRTVQASATTGHEVTNRDIEADAVRNAVTDIEATHGEGIDRENVVDVVAAVPEEGGA